MIIQKYLNSIDSQILDMKALGIRDEVIKARLIRKYKNQLLFNSFQTRNWKIIYDFIVNNKKIGNLQFCK